MPPPVRPSNFKAQIADPDDTQGQLIKKLALTLILWAKLYRYMFDENGRITPEFAADICKTDCSAATEETP